MTSGQRTHLRHRDEIFLSREDLAQRWRLSVREIIRRERSELKGLVYKFSYKVHRFRLSDIVKLEEAALQHETS
jgi:hypothetical protein